MLRRLAPRSMFKGRMPSSSAADASEVLGEQSGSVAVGLLNRPNKLNLLNENMIVRLQELYQRWEADSNVVAVILKGNGRAFCAGGDVASVCELGRQGNLRLPRLHDNLMVLTSTGRQHQASGFFYKEYVLNYYLATFKKPHVAFLNGVVMGGGNGVSVHGKYRVATEKTLFAMPETALGLHPDVGASYFLSRLDGHLGEYLGLTGERLDGADMLNIGLATHYVPSERLASLESELRSVSSPESVEETLGKFSGRPPVQGKSCLHRLQVINACFSGDTVEGILHALERERGDGDDEWLDKATSKLKGASPTSLKITLASIRRGRQESLAECLAREYRMSFRAVSAKYSGDFYEGCRAILIDKDNRPRWDPSKLEGVSREVVEGYFAALGDGEGGELQLPVGERGAGARSRARI
ncbi:3-hydroxyisobutyryl-CoA hydrolase 1 isoform X1 [Selaginella moellendorffii]|uniref:3-hydroxyisobutyryl-CoA hydrolase 1 isoform X1 n=1 Tax=Selaginella moellendorffii TaxID=88036 RepID=UPI000D1CF6FF|nr:3-hydroxyisobutyryl-CoA hydrolase 1 isoform X1 [Selaginella moellendorffii]|eukprot:XP_024526727.1 3-hydroxyisobutyryl-CoA hydrolase 1 isoform X1 [Selaginella moellendorffii]